MKWMFEEVYLKHNHKSKKTREQSVVFMYLQFNWPCWNFENEKWDILEKKKKVDDLRIPHQKRAWKSIKQLFLFLTTYSGDQTLCTWKSENMKKKNVIKQTNKQILIDSFAVILQFPKTNFTSKEIYLPGLFHINFWWKIEIRNLTKTIIFLRSEQTIQMKSSD